MSSYFVIRPDRKFGRTEKYCLVISVVEIEETKNTDMISQDNFLAPPLLTSRLQRFQIRSIGVRFTVFLQLYTENTFCKISLTHMLFVKTKSYIMLEKPCGWFE